MIHKSLVTTFEDLRIHYSASSNSIADDLDDYKARYEIRSSLDILDDPMKEKGSIEMERLTKILASYSAKGCILYHDNPSEFLPCPIVTAEDPSNLEFYNWGLIPADAKDPHLDLIKRTSTVDIFDSVARKPYLRNERRCLIPVSGYFQWHVVDNIKKSRIPYYIFSKHQPIFSIAGVYNQHSDPRSNSMIRTYAMATMSAEHCGVNARYLGNETGRIPAIISREREQEWLQKEVSRDKLLELFGVRSYPRDFLSARSISKLITNKNEDKNIPEILLSHEYPPAGRNEILKEL